VTIAYVELIAKERDRLLQRAARAVGLGSTAVALVCFSVPGVLDLATYIAVLPFFLLLALCQYRVGVNQSVVWVLLGVASGLAVLIVVQVPIGGPPGVALGTAIVPLAAGSIASFAIVLVSGVGRLGLLVLSFLATSTLAGLAIHSGSVVSQQSAAIVLGWALATVFGYWLGASVPRAARRIYSIGRAHRAERQASSPRGPCGRTVA
jgi:hypothetical protein